MNTIRTRSNVDVYLEHYGAAEQLLILAQGWAEQRNDLDEDAESSYLAAAQAHATLALAVAVTRMVATYDGWKDIGR